MDSKQREELAISVAKSLSEAAKAGRDHDVIGSGLLLYLANREEQNEALDSIPLVYVQSAIERIMKRLSGDTPLSVSEVQQCSFCGLMPPTVKLAAGPNAHICNQCIQSLSEVFGE